MQNQYSEYLEFAREIATAAGQHTLQYFQKGVRPDTKTDGSPVTIADRQSEQMIRQAIEKRYPSHAILGEEYGEKDSSAAFRWIIDPIDGTKSFVHGVPLYAVLLGLEIEGRVEVGVAYFPALNEIISAATGLGCWWNGQPARVSQVSNLSEAIFSFTDFGAFEQYGKKAALERLAAKTWYRPGWGDAYGYMLVATGRAEVMMDPTAKIWDCGPFPPIYREAGGYFGDWEGKGLIDQDNALGTSQALLPEVLALLKD